MARSTNNYHRTQAYQRGSESRQLQPPVDPILPCYESDRQGVLGECIVASIRALNWIRPISPNGCIDFQRDHD